jgi:hypothetical protein
MGASHVGCTEYHILRLQKLLADCLIEIGGLQQPAHSDSEEMAKQHEREYALGWQKVRDMVKDIAMALTGEEIKFPCDIKQDKLDKMRDTFDEAMEKQGYTGPKPLPIDDDEETDCDEEETLLDALCVFGNKVMNTLDKNMLDEDCGQWWLDRAKRIIREVIDAPDKTRISDSDRKQMNQERFDQGILDGKSGEPPNESSTDYLRGYAKGREALKDE